MSTTGKLFPQLDEPTRSNAPYSAAIFETSSSSSRIQTSSTPTSGSVSDDTYREYRS